MAPRTLDADILIVGGGFIGMAMAVAVAGVGLASVLVEAGSLRATLQRGFDGRASAIALSSRRLLSAIGVWDDLAGEAAPMLDIRVSEGDSRLFLHYDHREVGHEPFGHMLENRVLRRALLQRVESLAEVRLVERARVVRLDRSGPTVQAELSSGERVRAALVCAADGRDSRLREEAGIGVCGWPYRQTAIVTTVEHERGHDFIAHEHFLPAGPFAILPLLPETRSSIVWTERADLAPAIVRLPRDAFHRELRRRFGDFLGEVRELGPRFGHPLSLQFATRATDRRLVLLGDALHAMHPIAGQGLNMGLRDVAALADVLDDARRGGDDIGTAAVLDRYVRWRRFDNTLMLTMTDVLNRLFSNDVPPLRLARDAGLALVDRLPPLKRVFMQHAMGVVGDLPRLMRD